MQHENEQMYASEDAMGLHNRYNYVFTWKLKGPVDSKKSAWNIEMSGSDMRLRNVFNKKLLCVTSNKYDKDRRYVFTLADQMYIPNKSCFWVLESCDKNLKI